MKKMIVCFAFSLLVITLFAQEINGILFESRYPVTVRLDGQRVNLPSQTSFVTNLRPGVYNVQADNNGRIIFTDQIRYSGRGTLVISLDRGGSHPPVVQPGNPSGYVPAMDQRQFDVLLRSVNNEAFDDQKMPIIKMATLKNNFTSSQVASLIKTLSFSKSQIEMAKYLFKYSTDPENYYTIVGNSFTFSTDKRELEKYINQVLRDLNIR